VYYADLKILFSFRTGLQIEKNREIKGSSSTETNKNSNLPEGKDDTQGNHDDHNKKLHVHVKNLAI